MIIRNFFIFIVVFQLLVGSFLGIAYAVDLEDLLDKPYLYKKSDSNKLKEKNRNLLIYRKDKESGEVNVLRREYERRFEIMDKRLKKDPITEYFEQNPHMKDIVFKKKDKKLKDDVRERLSKAKSVRKKIRNKKATIKKVVPYNPIYGYKDAKDIVPRSSNGD